MAANDNLVLDQPQVAVLLAVHAGADASHFEEALRSMRAQTHKNLRLFVDADGPLTETHEHVIAKYLHCDPGRDLLVRGNSPAGLPVGLNKLIDVAMEDRQIAFLARMDADDISLPERIARQVAFMNENDAVSIAGTWCIEFTQPGIPSFHKQLPRVDADVRKFMLYRSPLAHPTVMFRRRVFDSGLRYSPSMPVMQDYELWTRLLNAGFHISNVPEYLLWFRMSEDFYSRRTGTKRAWKEVHLRWRYAKCSGLFRPIHLLGFLALFLLRISPVAIKRSAYAYLR